MFENMNLKIPAESAIQLSKRELFAAMAMQGIVSQDGWRPSRDVAFASIEYADALIAELEKKK